MILPKHVENRYIYVLLIAERAKQLIRGSKPSIETDKKDPISIAKEEVKRGHIIYFSPEEAKKSLDQIASEGEKEG